MLRYLRRLADKDLALDRTMIPLGSCTMKLNATAEMMPITWPEFADIHPFAPDDADRGLPRDDRRARGDARGDHRLRRGQPPAQRRQPGRVRRAAGDPRLPPQPRRRPAHGLPDPVERPRHQRGERGDGRDERRRRAPATTSGNVDLADLRAKARRGRRPLAAIMVTYPSTHGVFEEAIGEICAIVHDARRPGLRRRRQPQRPRRPGPARPLRRRRQPPQPAQDVLHPPRRRRPGRRAGRRCAPTSPRSCPAIRSAIGDQPVGAVSAAPFGSAGILPIPWVYIALMGAERAAPRPRADRHPLGELHRHAARRRTIPVLYTGAQRPRRPRVHHRPAADHQGDRCHRRRRRQAADRLRLPRPDDELPGRRHADDRADRERDAGRARPLLRGDDRDPGRDRPGRRRRVAARRRARCATRRTRPRTCSATGTGRTTASSARTRCRRCGRRKYFPPVSRIDAAYGDRNLSAPASRWRPTPRHS